MKKVTGLLLMVVLTSVVALSGCCNKSCNEPAPCYKDCNPCRS